MPPRSRGGRSKRRSQPLYAEDCAEEAGIKGGELHLALQRPDDYVRACQELAALLRLAYPVCTKRLQRYLEEQCLEAIACCSGKQRERKVLEALCREAKKRFPKQQGAQVEKAHKQLCLTQHRELRRYEAQAGETDEAPIQAMPDEVLAEALAMLPPRDLAAAMCVNRQWSQAARSPILWEGFVRRTFASRAHIAKVTKATETSADIPWHAVFGCLAESAVGEEPATRWHHNRVVVRGRLAWRDAFDPQVFQEEAPVGSSAGSAERARSLRSPTPEEAARIMLGEAAGSVLAGSPCSSSTSTSDEDSSSSEAEGEQGPAANRRIRDAIRERQRQRRLWAVPESMRNLSLGP